MKKLFLVPLLVCGVLCVLSTSCKKKNSNNTTTPAASTKDMLTGSWNLTQTADDDNKNGSLDDSEKVNLGTGESGTIIFNTDGTGSIYNVSPIDTMQETFMWTLQNNDKEVKILVPNFDTTVSAIQSISATDLTLLNDITDAQKSWIILKKK